MYGICYLYYSVHLTYRSILYDHYEMLSNPVQFCFTWARSYQYTHRTVYYYLMQSNDDYLCNADCTGCSQSLCVPLCGNIPHYYQIIVSLL